MIEKRFSLSPFPGLPFPSGIAVSGEATLVGTIFGLEVRVRGATESISLPSVQPSPRRVRGLWAETCFEFFLGESGGAYREFNLAPSGNWNVFRFDSYRKGMREDEGVGELPFRFICRPGAWDVGCRLDLSTFGSEGLPLSVGVSCVLKEPTGRITYWALSHPGVEPDFHHPEAFSEFIPQT